MLLLQYYMIPSNDVQYLHYMSYIINLSDPSPQFTRSYFCDEFCEFCGIKLPSRKLSPDELFSRGHELLKERVAAVKA